MKKSLVTLAAILALAVAPATAAIEETITVDIAYDVTELEHDRGALDTYRSLRIQARRACRSEPIGTSMRRVDFDCMREVMDEAVLAIRSPRLTALHTPSELRRVVLARR